MRNNRFSINDESLDNSISPWIFISVGLILLYLLVSSELKSYSERQSEDKILNDPNYNLANKIREAFHVSWISEVFFTADKETLLALAGEITDWDKLSKAYQDLYSESLFSRLQKAFIDEPKTVTLFLSKAKASGSGVGGTGKAIPTVGNLKLGSVATTLEKVSALDPNNSSKVLTTFLAYEECGKYLGDKLLSWTSSGKRYQTTFAILEGYLHWYSPSVSRYWIQKNKLITY